MKDAVQRAMELMETPRGKLPALATEFAQKLCREVGGCMEVFITAYAVYAQCVERLPCKDSLYKARPQDVEWFSSKERIS